MIKPIEYSVFSSETVRALSRIAKHGIVLIVKNNEGLFTVDSAEVGYIEVYNHRIILYTKAHSIPSGQTMLNMQKRLHGFPFFRCHTAFLINMDCIKRVYCNDVWIFGWQLPTSKHRRFALSAFSAGPYLFVRDIDYWLPVSKGDIDGFICVALASSCILSLIIAVGRTFQVSRAEYRRQLIQMQSIMERQKNRFVLKMGVIDEVNRKYILS